MFDCTNYKCHVDQEVFCAVACLYTGQLGKSLADCLYQYTFESQARNPKVKRSKKWGCIERIQQRREQRSKKLTSSFALFLGKYSTVMHADRISIVNVDTGPIGNSVHLQCLSFIFLIYKFPMTQLEIIVIVSSPITTGNRSCFSVFHCHVLLI